MDEQPAAERLWQLTAEHSPVGMTLVSPAGELLTANRALRAMLGYSEAELRVLTFQQITHPDDLESDLELFQQTLAGRRATYRLTKRYLHSDGSVVWGDLSVALLRADDGTPLHFISQVVDVTLERRRQEELAQALGVIDRQRGMAQAILDTVDVGLVLLDRHGHYERMNRRHQDFMLLAYPDGHARQAGQLGDVYAADGVTLMTQGEMPTIRAVNGEEFDDYRIWVGREPLERRALSVSARPVLDASGVFDGAVLAYKDVTDLMRALLARDDFVAAVSHELRTPLTAVLGHLEILLESPDLPSDVVHPVRVVQRNAVRLRKLVSDLIETAQHREGGVTLSRSTADIAELVAEAVESALPAAQSAGVALAVDTPGPVLAVVDQHRLRQVVDNLVSNALKYTDAGGRVDLLVRADDHLVEIIVADDGIGISAADQVRLFAPFFRSRQAQERHAPGIGLGLGIARTIVEAHGGSIDVTSASGVGTRFRVAVPRGVRGYLAEQRA